MKIDSSSVIFDTDDDDDDDELFLCYGWPTKGKSRTRRVKDLNLRRIWVQVSLYEVLQ